MKRSEIIMAMVETGQLTPNDAFDEICKFDLPSGGRNGDMAECPECGSKFVIEFVTKDGKLGHVNTCSDECQIIRNTIVFKCDSLSENPRIVKVADLTPERLNKLLNDARLTVIGTRELKPS